MIVPLTTDAPIYHRPYGTVGIILLNVLVFAITLGDAAAIDRWGLVHGYGLTPIQWLTSNFIHADLLHLLGNMVFLWGFGLIVEGKIGCKWFVPVYLCIGVVECGIEQLLFSGTGAVSFGASAVIFGLMTMALLWAPCNELTLGYWFMLRFGTFDLPIVWFAALTLLKSLLLIWAAAGQSSETLHMLGAGVGILVGLGMFWSRQVDCEGWDLISVMTGNTPRSDSAMSLRYQQDRRRRKKSGKDRRQRPRRAATPPRTVPSATQRFSDLIRAGKAVAAFAELQHIRHLRPKWRPREDEQLALARGLRKSRQWEESVATYQDFLLRCPDDALARLELSELLVFVQERPTAASRLLDGIDISGFSSQQRQRYDLVRQHARQLLDSGVIEIQGQAW